MVSRRSKNSIGTDRQVMLTARIADFPAMARHGLAGPDIASSPRQTGPSNRAGIGTSLANGNALSSVGGNRGLVLAITVALRPRRTKRAMTVIPDGT